MELDLRRASNPPVSDELRSGDFVRLYSEELDCELKLEITHQEPELGGVVRNPDRTPFLEPGDHVHFRSENVLSILD